MVANAPLAVAAAPELLELNSTLMEGLDAAEGIFTATRNPRTADTELSGTMTTVTWHTR